MHQGVGGGGWSERLAGNRGFGRMGGGNARGGGGVRVGGGAGGRGGGGGRTRVVDGWIRFELKPGGWRLIDAVARYGTLSCCARLQAHQACMHSCAPARLCAPLTLLCAHACLPAHLLGQSSLALLLHARTLSGTNAFQMHACNKCAPVPGSDAAQLILTMPCL